MVCMLDGVFSQAEEEEGEGKESSLTSGKGEKMGGSALWRKREAAGKEGAKIAGIESREEKAPSKRHEEERRETRVV